MSDSLKTVQRAQPLLGTLVKVRLVADPHASPARLHQYIDAAFSAMARVHRHMSYQDPDSTVSTLNRDACRYPVRVDPDTRAVLQAALGFAAESHGAFDPTVAPSLERWGYLPSVADPLPEPGDWRDVEIRPENEVRFVRPLRIDLSGIAKGYAVDLACEVLRETGVSSFCVNAGGDLRVGGSHIEDIGVRNPQDPGLVAFSIPLRDQALATSGSYFSRRRIGSHTVSSLLDPRSGVPHARDLSVTVRASTCIVADALTKVVLFASPDLAERVLSNHAADAFVVGDVLSAA